MPPYYTPKMKAFIFGLACLTVFLAGCDKSGANASPAVAKAAPQSPILAQSELFNYAGGEYVGFEGKIYNPNPFAITNVRVRWQLYPPWTGHAQTGELLAKGGFEQSCGFDFAYIPPKTTYDFKTEKIKARTPDTMDSLGEKPYPSFSATDLKPEITFKPEQ